MKAIASVVTWERVERPGWYEGLKVGDEYGPIAQEFWARKGCQWPLAVLAIWPVRPDGGVKPSFSFKLSESQWFMDANDAGSGLPPYLARRMGQLLIEHAGPDPCGLCGHDRFMGSHGSDKGCDVVVNGARCGCDGAS